MESNHSAELDAVYDEKVIGLLDKVVKKTALTVDRELVLETPVGNPSLWQSAPPAGYVGGRARSNWLASINSPRTDAGAQTTRKGSDTVRSKMGSFKIATDTIFITNNVPYIERLNNGWSTQAPIGFIAAIVARNRRKAAQVKGIVTNA